MQSVTIIQFAGGLSTLLTVTLELLRNLNPMVRWVFVSIHLYITGIHVI